MNIAVGQTRRLAVSPYARRLARERALPLEALRGSGPDGRILAADVLAFVPAAAPANAPDVAKAAGIAIAAHRIAAFAASLALGAVRDLLAALASAGKTFDIDDIVLRAVGRAFAENPVVGSGAWVALELGGRQMACPTNSEMPMTLLRASRLEALDRGSDDAEKPALLSLRLLPAGDIRPMMMALLPGRAMRLAVTVDGVGGHAECLLATDADSIDEAAAIAWLSSLKSAIESPLRLFV
ncbi:E3 binding domain-containing protein [Mesorhizobium sp. ES1-1]|uniref:E3 binding domain-containing protein n=1 Tax=Mesorhizobium sp. ES1-1 TaxID=2876629 RepID=UPI001CCF3531|nr:E3 binding domain-containing protein [Mesorhizobium sp. ES1-1]MBZ9674678.1 E3 binding domain-containing protein [Mesorhizobium sp. ES1-1]